uniref:Uncharacterized protein n=1 Tax=Globisporangium ultimum (strain ATCC 200006 / CBS 805.95 / DAOM BR144) TaxID=431595 RepID=K3W593_GLOUD
MAISFLCIVLMLLGYYNIGISLAEFRQVLKQLLRLGLSKQDQLYSKWYDAVKRQLSTDDMKEVPCKTRQFSQRDSCQAALLYSVSRQHGND